MRGAGPVFKIQERKSRILTGPRRSQIHPSRLQRRPRCARTEFYPSSKFNWEIPKQLQERNQALVKSWWCSFQDGRDRMHIVGEHQVQIPKGLEEKAKRGSVYNRRFLGGDCRFQPSLNSPEADPNGPTCSRFLENSAPLVISWRRIEQMTKFSRKGGADYKWK